MKLSVRKSKIKGDLTIPGSKSHTIRALAIASLAPGVSVIKAPLVSEDTISCLSAAGALGAWIKRGDDTVWKIHGMGGHLLEPATTLNMGDSGTGMRLFSAISSLASFPVKFDGDSSLRTRPMAPLLSALKALGVKTESADGYCPCSVQGPLHGGETEVDGTSSQYLSALLLAAPLAPEDTILNVPKLNEVPYVEMTLSWLKKQNIVIKHTKNFTRFHIVGRQTYQPFMQKIPGDFSTAAFPLCAAAVTGGSVRVSNLDFSDPQGDKAIIDHLRAMGCKIDVMGDMVVVRERAKLRGAELDLNATPDLLPVLAVVAACANGTTILKNVPQARIKETDRIDVMTTELAKMGVKVTQFEDGMSIVGGPIQPARVDSHRDHRVAMALAVAGLAAANKDDFTVIDEAECCAVTYPSFLADFQSLGAEFYEL